MKKEMITLAMLGMLVISPAFAGYKNSTTTTTHKTYSVRHHNVKHTNLMSVEDRMVLQENIESHVKQLDINKNKFIDRDEFVDFHTKQGATIEKATARFAILDINRNGFISSQEIMNEEMRIRANRALAKMAHYDAPPCDWEN